MRLHNTLEWRSAGIHTRARTLIAHERTPRVHTWSSVAHAEVMHIHVPPTRYWLSQETNVGSDCCPGSVAVKAVFQTYAKAPFQMFSRYFNAVGGYLMLRQDGKTAPMAWNACNQGSGEAADRQSVWVSLLRWKQSIIGFKKAKLQPNHCLWRHQLALYWSDSENTGHTKGIDLFCQSLTINTRD